MEKYRYSLKGPDEQEIFVKCHHQYYRNELLVFHATLNDVSYKKSWCSKFLPFKAEMNYPKFNVGDVIEINLYNGCGCILESKKILLSKVDIVENPGKENYFIDYTLSGEVISYKQLSKFKPFFKASQLLEATLEFEKILPKYSYNAINTSSDPAYGELHHIYYDVADHTKEDPALIKLLQPFVKMTHMTITHYDPCVEDLRKYLEETCSRIIK